ncbi:helix-turn-helix transcriptional regulator [Larsenimonas rhizosphaerae]|uniref:helix-turn-helix transcriptional regulator n=1 Tax=Larsenimonas rhizosphaerae TaxID=2944682 RepID=UPI0020349D3C|nr:AlpA family transcriptional regulator [Larsenimonas rhizosphaerae]MCM2131970.1 AlpA family transcriptional regulator [Larsenimonas rhizosphaerae]
MSYRHTDRLDQYGHRLLRRKEVEHKTGKARSTLYADIARGTFPAPVPIGNNSVAWLEEEVDRWIDDRLHQRNAQLAAIQTTVAQEARL